MLVRLNGTACDTGGAVRGIGFPSTPKLLLELLVLLLAWFEPLFLFICSFLSACCWRCRSRWAAAVIEWHCEVVLLSGAAELALLRGPRSGCRCLSGQAQCSLAGAVWLPGWLAACLPGLALGSAVTWL